MEPAERITTFTRLTMHISDPTNPPATWQIDVQEDWDTVFNQCYPIQPPSSSLESRQNMWFTRRAGGRLAIMPSNIYCFEEITEDV